MRCATVGGAVRKARAISSVVSPQTSRSVSAICASGGSAGWQQVKIRRSRSSSTSPSCAALPLVPSSASRSAISASDASKRARRRMRVDRLEAAGRDEPGARIGGHAVARPLLERGGEGVVQRLLGEVEVAEQADQGGEDAARVGAVDRVDGSGGVGMAHVVAASGSRGVIHAGAGVILSVPSHPERSESARPLATAPSLRSG